MKIYELIRTVANMVERRDTIDHGTIRCLYSEQAISSIESCESCESVGTGTIGDDDLAADLATLADDGDRIAELDFGDLAKLESAFCGENIGDYVDGDKEDELQNLDKLIDAAREII